VRLEEGLRDLHSIGVLGKYWGRVEVSNVERSNYVNSKIGIFKKAILTAPAVETFQSKNSTLAPCFLLTIIKQKFTNVRKHCSGTLLRLLPLSK
jgi:hypothetical protein